MAPMAYTSLSYGKNAFCSREEEASVRNAELIDVSESHVITYDTLLKRSYPKYVKEILNEFECIKCLFGHEGFVKIRVNIEDGHIDAIVQKIDAYLLAVIRNGRIHEYTRKNVPKRFANSNGLYFSESYPNLAGLKLGLKQFKQAVRNVILKEPDTWALDLALITVTLCEGPRFNPVFKLLCHLMRAELDKRKPWILIDPFPDMFQNWGKMSKIVGDEIIKKLSTGEDITFNRYTVPKLKRMTGKQLEQLVKIKSIPFAIFCLKWPHPKSFDIGTAKIKGDWLYRAPQLRNSMLLEEIRNCGCKKTSSSEESEYGRRLWRGRRNGRRDAGGGRNMDLGKQYGVTNHVKRVSRTRVDSWKQNGDIACSSSKVNDTVFNGSHSPKLALSETGSYKNTKYKCSVGLIICEIIKPESYTGTPGTKRFSADKVVRGTISPSHAPKKNRNPEYTVNPNRNHSHISSSKAVSYPNTKYTLFVGTIKCEIVERESPSSNKFSADAVVVGPVIAEAASDAAEKKQNPDSLCSQPNQPSELLDKPADGKGDGPDLKSFIQQLPVASEDKSGEASEATGGKKPEEKKVHDQAKQKPESTEPTGSGAFFRPGTWQPPL